MSRRISSSATRQLLRSHQSTLFSTQMMISSVMVNVRHSSTTNSGATPSPSPTWSFFDDVPPAKSEVPVPPKTSTLSQPQNPQAPNPQRPTSTRASGAPPPPPPPPTSSANSHNNGNSLPQRGGGNVPLPSARGYRTPPEVLDALIGFVPTCGYRTPPEVLDALIGFVPTFWVSLPTLLEAVTPDLRELLTINNTVPPTQFLEVSVLL
ncbi:Hypothetical protein, putative [Bodo saltans]|uniref:Uncharacterized protein n=1 Tax=Bodo saltans TaxID=75058 RepID=A0A0S4JY90_BODSA|nr:Hypothetical protein, putative [Bodo saltans]|eukprot:CUG94334.1 Hypothetical protein, putative [Bodo saltans]